MNQKLSYKNTDYSLSFSDAPQRPSFIPETDTSLVFGKSAFQAESLYTKDRYKPLKNGGFKLIDQEEQHIFNREIVHGRNKLQTGDKPVFKVCTVTGSGVYDGVSVDKSFPLFPRDNAEKATNEPCLGILNIVIINQDGTEEALEEQNINSVIFMPGYTEYIIEAKNKKWNAELVITPNLESHGFILSIKLDTPQIVKFAYGSIYWISDEKNSNTVDIKKNVAILEDTNLPNAVVITGISQKANVQKNSTDFGDEAIFITEEPVNKVFFQCVWGVTDYDKENANTMLSRLDSNKLNKKTIDKLKQEWFDCYIGRALKPQSKYDLISKDPNEHQEKSLNFWKNRLNEFQVNTPDNHFNAAVNFQRCISEYHRLGPGLVLSADMWVMYSHISVGWYGKMWGGDIETVKQYLRFFASMQGEDGYIHWISPSLAAYVAENNTPYWIEQIWWVYAWEGDLEFIKEMWPLVKKGINYEQSENDPDNDGLFKSRYEYWNCDSNGKGPKAATPTTTAWGMYTSAAKMAEALNKPEDAKKYFEMADKIQNAAMSELWNEKEGVLTSIGKDEIQRLHPQIWEEYLPIINGMLSKEKGIRALEYIESHYGLDGDEGVRFLLNCDWWPLRWSVHWAPVGDTLLASMAGMACGAADTWWQYVQTVVKAQFRRSSPTIGFGISNTGSSGGDIENVDSVDPFSHFAVRGLFGVTPELHKNILHIAPAFPSSWEDAEIKTPLFAYKYKRKGNKVTLNITSKEAIIKIITPYLGAEKITTPSETSSIVEFEIKSNPCKTSTDLSKNALAQFPNKNTPEPISDKDLENIEILDLGRYYNTTLKKLTNDVVFVSDIDEKTTIAKWWHTVPASLTAGDEIIKLDNGLPFMMKNRNKSIDGDAESLLALSSWGEPFPFPGAAELHINKPLKAFWIMMQNYVSPIKNYIPNGEIILSYDDNSSETIQLIPPYNMDCYFQDFSQEGISVEIGELTWDKGWTPCPQDYCKCQANVLKIACNPNKTLNSITVKATVTEGVIGINAITLLKA
jgi:hypothetical protein